jgi:hypothetical protein
LPRRMDELRKEGTSAPFPKFASLVGRLSCELRKHQEH